MEFRLQRERSPGRPAEAAPDLLAACRSGDREAFHELFLLYRNRVYTTAFFLTRAEHVAADITQQVFLKLMTHVGSYRAESRFTTWLFQIVVNAARDERRRTRRLVALGEHHAETPGPEPAIDECLGDEQQKKLLWAGVDTLPFRLRAPVVLRYLEDRSYEEIAETLGCSKGTVASRLHRAHTILARRLAKSSGRR